MAIDWIKMRCDLQSHPKVVRIMSATKADKFRVVGGLHAVWGVFDAHSVDGVLQGYTPAMMDHIIGWEGFSGAMIAVGWLAIDGAESLVMPEFGEHNGKSAKRRAEDQKRKRDKRTNVRNASASCPPESGTRKDKNRRKEEEEDDAREPVDGGGHPNLREIFQVGMADDWEPSGKTFPAICLRAGVKPDYTPEQLGEFKNFYLDPAKNKPRTQHDWERLFSGWLKGDNGRGKATSTGSGSDQPGSDRDEVRRSLSDAGNLDWAADLIEPAGGCGG